MIKKKSRNSMRKKRHIRARKSMVGTPLRPRLSVYRSNNNLYAQVIDDINAVTLASASTVEKDDTIDNGGNKEAATVVGEKIAKRALENNIKSVVFDRSGYKYHGRVKALADAARDAGLKF
ncbi:MAG: 50S ribosomal protein L18 [Candidatus Izimaplasma sp.]|nr:50S ribosomal protein L18 [Candidatus Izimaplasma bacterium]